MYPPVKWALCVKHCLCTGAGGRRRDIGFHDSGVRGRGEGRERERARSTQVVTERCVSVMSSTSVDTVLSRLGNNTNATQADPVLPTAPLAWRTPWTCDSINNDKLAHLTPPPSITPFLTPRLHRLHAEEPGPRTLRVRRDHPCPQPPPKLLSLRKTPPLPPIQTWPPSLPPHPLSLPFPFASCLPWQVRSVGCVSATLISWSIPIISGDSARRAL